MNHSLTIHIDDLHERFYNKYHHKAFEEAIEILLTIQSLEKKTIVLVKFTVKFLLL
jgi:hypothetical protein